MSIPPVCAACGASMLDTGAADELDVCAACLRLHVQLAATVAEPEPPPSVPLAMREPPEPETAASPPLQHQDRWQVVADGYRRLCKAMLVLLIGVPAAVGVRFIVQYQASRSSRYDAKPSPIDAGSIAFLLVVGVALLVFIGGVIALRNKPKGNTGRGIALALCVFAFVPVVNLIAFPVLFVIYTAFVGADTGGRSVRRSAWILLGCAVVLTPSAAALVISVGYVVIDLVFVYVGWQPITPSPRPDPNPTPAPTGLLFGVAAGFVLWLGAYIVTMMILSSVARAVEKHSRTNPVVPPADFEYVSDDTP